MTLLRDGTILRLFPGSLHENGSCEEPPSLDMPIDVTQTVEGLSTTITFTFNAVEGEEIQEPHPSNPGYTMLCAEDNAVNQRYFYRFFSMFGQDVAMTENGEEAFELYKSKPERFPCIFMDLMMPVIRQIRAFESSRSGCHRRALIVGLSTHPVPLADISTLSEVGFDLVMRKPIDDRELYQMFLGSPRTNIVLLYGDLTEEEKSAYPRSLGPLVESEPSSAAFPSVNLDSIALLAALLVKPFSTATRESRRDSLTDLPTDRPTLYPAFYSAGHITGGSACGSACWPLRFYDLRHILTGTLRVPALPPYPFSSMSTRARRVPATPRVISPSPTPSELSEASRDGASYLGPVTRSTTRRRQTGSMTPHLEAREDESDPELRRARARSRSPIKTPSISRLAKSKPDVTSSLSPIDDSAVSTANGATKSSDGLLAPPPATGASAGWNWRDFSRSPSPLGLIPIHRHFQTLIHKHEVPRKALHVSIGFFVYWLYVTGSQTSAVTPYLMAALVPIATVDFLRHQYPSLNRFYVRYLGALMRETEYAGWNGVIFYLLGAWIVLRFFPKDVSVVAVMLLSWCDTAASTFGRLYGRYTPRIRRGKSLAGSLAACLVGVATAGWFWGILAPRTGPFPGDDQHPFMFQGVLRLPAVIVNMLGLDESPMLVGNVAVGVLSLWSGLVAAGSEVIDLFGWDDNLTIPVLSGVGIWGFLKLFG
ncbi:hypothetical protein F4777DRAFT_574628 [Nemania sp. FL0916]|nr:hypothetical protein F4777DRAFT_574628 [Nemania sp. FL0916]